MTNKWSLALLHTRQYSVALVNHVNVDDIPYILKTICVGLFIVAGQVVSK